jgi:hypothetical protein
VLALGISPRARLPPARVVGAMFVEVDVLRRLVEVRLSSCEFKCRTCVVRVGMWFMRQLYPGEVAGITQNRLGRSVPP